MEHELDLTTAEGIVAFMSRSDDTYDWNKRAKIVQQANGKFPLVWYTHVIDANLPAKVAKGWQHAGRTARLS